MKFFLAGPDYCYLTFVASHSSTYYRTWANPRTFVEALLNIVVPAQPFGVIITSSKKKSRKVIVQGSDTTMMTKVIEAATGNIINELYHQP